MSEVMGITLIVIGVYNIIGLVFCSIEGISKDANGLEFMNPRWVYSKHTNLNWFGAIMLSLVCTVICPIGAICYWFHKLCTIGRK